MITIKLKLIITVCHSFPFNWVCNQNKSISVKNIVVRAWLSGGRGGKGVTTQRRCAVSGNRRKKVGTQL